MDRRHPHQPFDRTLIDDFLRGRNILSVDLLPAGKSNSNYKLVLSDGEVCVLRLYSHGDAERETYVMNLVRKLVPVPAEMARGETWSVFSFLEGEHLEQVPEHSGAAAEALARISALEFKSAGIIYADGTISPFPFGGSKGFITEKLEDVEVRAWLGEETVDAIIAILQKEARRLAELDAQSSLVHGDFNPTNILIHRGKVSGILDWEFCHSGTPYMDIGNLLRNTASHYHRAIKQGLEAGGLSVPDDWNERAELVDVTSQLEFLTSNRSKDFKHQCAARIKKFISRFSERFSVNIISEVCLVDETTIAARQAPKDDCSIRIPE
jgi:aminoglycoside phosphotransferase (APT) family kinase protein